MSRFLVAVIVAAVAVAGSFGNVISFNVPVPLDKAGRGQDLIGPIENYTCPSNGAFPDEDDCVKFILCWDGVANLYECTDVMLYDLRYNGCNYAEYVDCGDRRRPPDYPGTVTPPLSTTTPNGSIPTTPPPNSTFDCPANGVFPHERCEYYWNCFDGVATLVHCELNYLFDLRYNGCNFPEYVDCGERERPGGVPPTVTPPAGTTTPRPTRPGDNSTAPSTTSNPGDFRCPAPEGRFPDPEDCGAFYSCVGNIPIHEKCPAGLHFNPVAGLCDWPESVGCQTR